MENEEEDKENSFATGAQLGGGTSPPCFVICDSWIPGKGGLLSIFRYFHFKFCLLW